MSTSTQPMRSKHYVTVDVRVDPIGRIRPLIINFDAQHIYHIDRVLAVVRRDTPYGNSGHCFTCMISGKERELWLEKGKWFVEAYSSTKSGVA